MKYSIYIFLFFTVLLVLGGIFLIVERQSNSDEETARFIAQQEQRIIIDRQNCIEYAQDHYAEEYTKYVADSITRTEKEHNKDYSSIRELFIKPEGVTYNELMENIDSYAALLGTSSMTDYYVESIRALNKRLDSSIQLCIKTYN